MHFYSPHSEKALESMWGEGRVIKRMLNTRLGLGKWGIRKLERERGQIKNKMMEKEKDEDDSL